MFISTQEQIFYDMEIVIKRYKVDHLFWSTWISLGKEKKEEIGLSPMTKLINQQKCQKGKVKTHRIRTISWSNYGHPTGVVNLVYGPNLPTPATAV